MMKLAKRSLLLAVVLLLTLGTPGSAGTAGQFAKALKDRFCSGTSGPMWYGCYAYMHYRVDLVKNRNTAKSICYKNGCGSRYGSGPQKTVCTQGCDRAYNADTR